MEVRLKTVVINAALVGVGGFIGVISRYALNGIIQRKAPQMTFSVGTLAVNLLGCLLIGVLAGFMGSR